MDHMYKHKITNHTNKIKTIIIERWNSICCPVEIDCWSENNRFVITGYTVSNRIWIFQLTVQRGTLFFRSSDPHFGELLSFNLGISAVKSMFEHYRSRRRNRSNKLQTSPVYSGSSPSWSTHCSSVDYRSTWYGINEMAINRNIPRHFFRKGWGRFWYR